MSVKLQLLHEIYDKEGNSTKSNYSKKSTGSKTNKHKNNKKGNVGVMSST